MDGGVVLGPGWWCWLEAPVVSPGWSASPVFIEQVEPLGTGRNLLRLGFIQAMHPVAAQRRAVVLRVQHRGARHLLGTIRDDDGAIRGAIIAEPDFGWLESYCPRLLRGRPPAAPTLYIVGKPPPKGPTPARYLDAALGSTPERILRGAAAASFGKDHPPMPARQGRFTLGLTFPPFESWLIARGTVPAEMEEKWFIHMEEGRLLFRRSWTGNLIYDVEAGWEEDRLRLGEVRVNRDSAQYAETDDARDTALLAYLIRTVLLGEAAAFPTAADTPPELAAMQAWSVAGKASL